MAKERIIVVDDEKSMRDFLEIMLAKEGYDVRTFPTGAPALDYCRENRVDLVITDMKMPGMDGVELLRELKSLNPDAPVIMVTAYASVDTAIDAMKAGAYDYFTKPFKVDEVKLHIARALDRRRVGRENRLLKQDLQSRAGLGGLVGSSGAMAVVYRLIMSVAPTRASVFITGESGTGKELVARAIHGESPRKDGPFVAVNCGAIPQNLLESELFGHQKGAFTGAIANKEGLVELADNGTLFLDEVTELPVELQVKLLRFIQERTLRRVGGTADIDVDIRIIASSNRDVEKAVKDGLFREDLFYRLNVIRIAMPPLRDRREDIPSIARHFLEKYSAELGKRIERISEEALKPLMDHDYSGNVRELENIVERAVALETSPEITLSSLPPGLGEMGRAAAVPARAEAREVPTVGIDLEKAVSDFERALMLDALKKSGGVKTKAAELLGLSFRSFRYKLGKYEEHGD
jgi:two-component system response regulator PilR (NtrC family)